MTKEELKLEAIKYLENFNDCANCRNRWGDCADQLDEYCLENGCCFATPKEQDIYLAGAEFGYNKANEWHYVKDGDLPKDKETVLALCIVGGKPYPYLAQYWKDNTKREKEGVDLNWICWRNNLQREVVEPYAWKEIVLPELKESE